MSLSERNYMGKGQAVHVPTTKVTTPPAAPAPKAEAIAQDPPRLWQFNLQHRTLPGCVSVTVYADTANARGLAYLVAEEFCQQIIGQIKQK
jgi:hypothetical protein